MLVILGILGKIVFYVFGSEFFYVGLDGFFGGGGGVLFEVFRMVNICLFLIEKDIFFSICWGIVLLFYFYGNCSVFKWCRIDIFFGLMM